MSPPVVPLAVVTFLLLISPAATSSAELARPLAAMAYHTEDGALVTWIPGAEAPDFYRVYGAAGGTEYLLATVTTTEAAVPTGFTSYSVTAVQDAQESLPVIALYSAICISFTHGFPPYPVIGERCGTDGRFGIKVELP